MFAPPMARAEDPLWQASLVETLMRVADADGVSATTLAQAWREARSRVHFLRDVEVADIGDLPDRSATEAAIAAGRLMVLEHGDRRLLPRFQFDSAGLPRAEVADVLTALGRSGWTAALWFRARSPLLDDARPYELLGSAASRVVDAARHEARALQEV